MNQSPLRRDWNHAMSRRLMPKDVAIRQLSTVIAPHSAWRRIVSAARSSSRAKKRENRSFERWRS
jgi:hypothetical protein